MAKRIFILLIIIVGTYFLLVNLKFKQEKKAIIRISSPSITPSVKPPIVKETDTIFIPYWVKWQGDFDWEKYDRVFYFGIAPSLAGIDKNEAGYQNLSKFSQITNNKQNFLVLRMVNDETNDFVLKDSDLQQKIIEETADIVKQYKFNGLALDLEIDTLPTDEDVSQINNFVKRFSSRLLTLNSRLVGGRAKFLIILYGDTFYRKRPFDLSFINKNSDEIMVMAYDFHKSRGEPGPNFPFDRRSIGGGGSNKTDYGYDFKNMVDDFLIFVPPNKLSIIFGMFGYDWRVDEKKRPIVPASALTLTQIKNKFLPTDYLDHDRDEDKQTVIKCLMENCTVKRDDLAEEMEINYTVSSEKPDEAGIYRIDYHIIWFEDEESAKVKIDYLKERGIGSVGYWAFNYF